MILFPGIEHFIQNEGGPRGLNLRLWRRDTKPYFSCVRELRFLTFQDTTLTFQDTTLSALSPLHSG
jgi:hypothetical protein